ncbi:hypothetical protein [Tepidibacter aestuarii]|uniref:hypothetical protein n=1 Tax=Tepidibacter aestuarii TaxID=2925782 RepID=UPI0020BEDE22|nr:hypothetical protein [Tepidibacter aestuarii]CAH2213424.1 protein of unknown function [Tepidibacter aestuarii]
MKSKYQCIANIRGGPIRPQIKGIVFIKDVSGGGLGICQYTGIAIIPTSGNAGRRLACGVIKPYYL